ncbi:MAG: hypothetical protein A2Y38_17035 [Spirochaetes bacterium GWB1_59_5]|nr:MAG: hypothetical protein A2Y38_17035 [Spirochaetes bacterium GWB1_59_5]
MRKWKVEVGLAYEDDNERGWELVAISVEAVNATDAELIALSRATTTKPVFDNLVGAFIYHMVEEE